MSGSCYIFTALGMSGRCGLSTRRLKAFPVETLAILSTRR